MAWCCPIPTSCGRFYLPSLAGIVFGVFLVAWIAKTVAEFREGRGSVPKTLLIAITTMVSFCLPMGSNLDVLFQGYNTWHSFQYLFLLWLINRLRDQRGEIRIRFVRRLVRRSSMAAYYACFLGATGVIVLLTLAVRAVNAAGRRSELLRGGAQRAADALLLRSFPVFESADDRVGVGPRFTLIRRGSKKSVVAQGNERIDFGRAPGREIGGEQTYGEKHQ